jgi:molybdopterin-guanine dinucleotide biosynthesis protein A
MTPELKSDITGCILAGGQGIRVGGKDKGLITLNGRYLSQHCIERLSPQVGSLIISANRNIPIYESFGSIVIKDKTNKSSGPLSGFHGALEAATTSFVAFTPCDAPFFPQNLVEKLMEPFSDEKTEITMAIVRTKHQPVFAMVKSSLENSLALFLENGGRKIRSWFDTRTCVTVEFDDKGEFMNINSPSDLEKAELWSKKNQITAYDLKTER